MRRADMREVLTRLAELATVFAVLIGAVVVLYGWQDR